MTPTVVSAPLAPRSRAGKGRWLAAAVILAATLYFWRLGAGSLAEWDEALTAERSREYLLGAPWHSVSFNLAPDFNKPPLYYWLTAALMRVAGEHEWTARFWSALFGLGCNVMVWALAARLGGSRKAGWIAAALLLLNPHWVNLSRQAMLDTGEILSMLAAIWIMERRPRSARAALLAGCSLGLGMLLKGPFTIGALLWPLARAFARGVNPLERKDRLKSIGIALAAACALGVPWYLLQWRLWGAPFVEKFFGHNLLERVTQTIEGHDQSPLSYLAIWLDDATILAGALIAGALIALELGGRVWRRAAFPGAALIVLTVFLMLMASRRTTYLAYLYPLGAVAAGILWAEILRPLPPRRAGMALGTAAFVAAALFGAGFDRNLDFARGLKNIADRAARDLPDNGGLLSIQVTTNVLTFYSRPGWRRIQAEEWPQALESVFDGGATVCFTVGPQKDIEALAETQSERFEHRVTEREERCALMRTTLRRPAGQE